MSVNWDDLRVFLAVARDESLSGAGRRLRMDPATVGRRILRLEQSLGTALFLRSPHGYSLTETGRGLRLPAEQAEAAMRGLSDTLAGSGAQNADGRIAGVVRIGAPDGCANFLLPRVCAGLSARHPDLEIQIVALPRVANLSKREVDMAITVSPPQAGRVRVQKIAHYHLSLAATPGYLASTPPILAPSDLSAHKIIGYIPDLIFDPELDYLSELGLGPANLSSNSVSVQFNWLRQGSGVGVVHDFALGAEGGLVRVLPEQVRLKRAFYLVRPQEDARLTRMTRLSRLLQEAVREEIALLEEAANTGDAALAK